jgi:hypothetical protein
VRAIAGVVALEAVRGRVPWLVAAVLLAGVGVAEFTSHVAITESREVARGLLGAWLRLCAVFVVALFVVTSMVRDLHDKGTELVLALALPRAVYLVGRLGGYAAVALAIALACTLLIAFFVPSAQAALWGATLACEVLIVAALSVLCLLTLSHVTLGMSAVMAFYLLSRAMDAIVLIGASTLAGAPSGAQRIMAGILDGIAFVLPDLDRFARSEWLIHGNAELADLGAALLQTLIYLLLLAGAALFDLQRKVL